VMLDVIVTLSGFSIEGFHSYGSSVEHLCMSDIEDILSATLVSCDITCSLYRVTQYQHVLGIPLVTGRDYSKLE